MANGPRIQQLKTAISECKQTTSMTVDEYYSKLMGYYDELARLKPLPACECHKCDCGLGAKLARDRDEEIFHQFLIGLDSSLYAAVRTNLLSQQPLGDINRAYQTLLQEEQSRIATRDKGVSESVHAFYTQSDRGKSRFPRVDKSKLVCTHCKQKGHDISTCFKIHGTPEWYEERVRNRTGRVEKNASAVSLAAGSSSQVAGTLGGVGGGDARRCRWRDCGSP